MCQQCKREKRARQSAKITRYGYRRANWLSVRKQRLELVGHVCELRILCDGARATHVHLRPDFGGNHDAAAVDDARACCIQCSGAIDGARRRDVNG